jgi:cysteine-rich repeat protein
MRPKAHCELHQVQERLAMRLKDVVCFALLLAAPACATDAPNAPAAPPSVSLGSAPPDPPLGAPDGGFVKPVVSADGAVAVCGNGITESGEACDQGPQNDDKAPKQCRTNCTNGQCGDGVLDLNEECDNGELNSDAVPGACRKRCKLSFCGDGVQDSNETCDDGDQDDKDECSNTCKPAGCGDGVKAGQEECDEGPADTATCRKCRKPRCGDGVTDSAPAEECDDGNTINNDGCTAACKRGCTDTGERACKQKPGTCADGTDGVKLLTFAPETCEAATGACVTGAAVQQTCSHPAPVCRQETQSCTIYTSTCNMAESKCGTSMLEKKCELSTKPKCVKRGNDTLFITTTPVFNADGSCTGRESAEPCGAKETRCVDGARFLYEPTCDDILGTGCGIPSRQLDVRCESRESVCQGNDASGLTWLRYAPTCASGQLCGAPTEQRTPCSRDWTLTCQSVGSYPVVQIPACNPQAGCAMVTTPKPFAMVCVKGIPFVTPDKRCYAGEPCVRSSGVLGLAEPVCQTCQNGCTNNTDGSATCLQ